MSLMGRLARIERELTAEQLAAKALAKVELGAAAHALFDWVAANAPQPERQAFYRVLVDLDWMGPAEDPRCIDACGGSTALQPTDHTTAEALEALVPPAVLARLVAAHGVFLAVAE